MLLASYFLFARIMLIIIPLLCVQKNRVKTLCATLPKILTLILDSILGEVGDLGFIILLLCILVTEKLERGIRRILKSVSKTFLSKIDLLFECFEVLHTVFFKDSISFFLIVGITIYAILRRISEL